MELNYIISRWLNGEDFSVNILLPQPFSFLKKNIIKSTKEDAFVSFSESYHNMYCNRQVKHKKKLQNIPELIFQKEIKGFLRPLFEFQRYVRKMFTNEELVGAYVHGSLGTMDYVEGYSDFDALFILKKEVFDNKEALKNIRRKTIKANAFLYLLDPLQHHNLFIISELDMQYYFETIFPLVLFDYAKEVTDFNNNLEFQCLDEAVHFKEIIVKKNNYFNKMAGNVKRMSTFDLKNIIQNILILPALYLQAKTKQYSYKKFTFENVKEDFSSQELEVIQKASFLRQKYKFKTIYSYWFRKIIGFKMHYKLLKTLHKYFDKKDSKYILQIMGNNFIYDALGLMKNMESKLYGKN